MKSKDYSKNIPFIWICRIKLCKIACQQSSNSCFQQKNYGKNRKNPWGIEMYFPHTTWVTPMHVLQYMLESMYLSWRIICQKATQEQHMAAFSGSYKLYTNCSFHKLKYVFASSVPCQYIDEHALHSGPCHLGFLTSVLLCLKAS